MKQTYIRCPRCELNYILKKDKFCNVCKTEMKALGTLGAEENLDLELCPICKANYINSDEDICAQCAKEKELEDGTNGSEEKYNNKWDDYNSQDEEENNYQSDDGEDIESISNLDDTPLTDDEMDLGISDDEDENLDDEDSEEVSEEDDDFDIGDDEIDDEGDEDDYDDDFDDDEKPSKNKKK